MGELRGTCVGLAVGLQVEICEIPYLIWVLEGFGMILTF